MKNKKVRDRDVLGKEKVVSEKINVHWEVKMSNILRQNLNPIRSSIMGRMM
jgi:hypothetical protein